MVQKSEAELDVNGALGSTVTMARPCTEHKVQILPALIMADVYARLPIPMQGIRVGLVLQRSRVTP